MGQGVGGIVENYASWTNVPRTRKADATTTEITARVFILSLQEKRGLLFSDETEMGHKAPKQ